MGNFLVLSPNFPSGSYHKFRNTKGYRANHAPPYGGGDGGGAGCLRYISRPPPSGRDGVGFLLLLPLHIPCSRNRQEQDNNRNVSDGLSGRDTCWVEVEDYGMLTWFHAHSTEDIVNTSQLCRLTVDSGCPTRIVDLREDDNTTIL